MIEKISLKNVATYGCEVQELKNLKEINFIYGANGSGKTTISNYVKSISIDKYKECGLVWKGNNPLQAFVYNKTFKDENFLSGEIQGVFTLGNATIEQEKELQSKIKETTELDSQLERARSSEKNLIEAVDDLNKDLLEISWTLNKENEIFKEALRGFRGSKSAFYKKLQLESKKNNSVLMTKKELEDKLSSLMGKKPDEIEEFLLIDYAIIKKIEKNEIFEKSIVGKKDLEIGSLIDKLNNSFCKLVITIVK